MEKMKKNNNGFYTLINSKGEEVNFHYTIDVKEALELKDANGKPQYTNGAISGLNKYAVKAEMAKSEKPSEKLDEIAEELTAKKRGRPAKEETIKMEESAPAKENVG